MKLNLLPSQSHWAIIMTSINPSLLVMLTRTDGSCSPSSSGGLQLLTSVLMLAKGESVMIFGLLLRNGKLHPARPAADRSNSVAPAGYLRRLTRN